MRCRDNCKDKTKNAALGKGDAVRGTQRGEVKSWRVVTSASIRYPTPDSMPTLRFLAWLLSSLVSLAILGNVVLAEDIASQDAATKFFGQHASSESGHTNNWAVLVCASRYWFNYRVCEVPYERNVV
jgi:hypothetical protein